MGISMGRCHKTQGFLSRSAAGSSLIEVLVGFSLVTIVMSAAMPMILNGIQSVGGGRLEFTGSEEVHSLIEGFRAKGFSALLQEVWGDKVASVVDGEKTTKTYPWIQGGRSLQVEFTARRSSLAGYIQSVEVSVLQDKKYGKLFGISPRVSTIITRVR